MMRLPFSSMLPKARVLSAANRAVECLGTGVHPVRWKQGKDVVTVDLPKLAAFRGHNLQQSFTLCGSFSLARYPSPLDRSAEKASALCDAVLLRGADAYLPAYEDGPKSEYKHMRPVEMTYDDAESRWSAVFWMYHSTVPQMRDMPFPFEVTPLYHTSLPAAQLPGLQRALFLEWAGQHPRVMNWGVAGIEGHVVSSELALAQHQNMLQVR